MYTSIIAFLIFMLFMGVPMGGRNLLEEGSYVFFYLIAAILLSFLSISELHDSYRLYTGQVKTQGLIKNTDCGNHGHITYEFQVEQRSFSRQIRASQGGLNCKELLVGSVIPVEYLKEEPEISIAGNASDWLSESFGFTLATALGGPALFIFFSIRQKRKRNMSA